LEETAVKDIRTIITAVTGVHMWTSSRQRCSSGD